MEGEQPRAKLSEKALINVSGNHFEIMWSIVKMRPLTRLEKLYKCFLNDGEWESFCDGFNYNTQEFFFQRDPEVFRSVMNFYWTNKLHFPKNICIELFQREIKYWGISIKYIDDCCHNHFHQETEALDNLHKIKSAFKKNMSKRKQLEEALFLTTKAGKCSRFKESVWDLFENPRSSRKAKVVYFLSSFFVLFSTLALCLNTVDSLRVQRSDGTTGDNPTLALIEAVCIAWFTLEYIVRLISSPGKGPFFKSIMNTIDLLAILPYFISLLFEAFDNKVDARLVEIRRFLQILRILRIVRIFKMARHSIGLQTLAYTFKQSTGELTLLLTLLLMGMTLFSSLVYFADEGDPKTMFNSIPEAFWWSVITMTTVGYGDIYPVTPFGKLVGCLCCISGIIFIALPIPTIVSNFSQFYKDQRKNVEVMRRLSTIESSILTMPFPALNVNVDAAENDLGKNTEGQSCNALRMVSWADASSDIV